MLEEALGRVSGRAPSGFWCGWGCGLTSIFYGFAQGLMTSLVAQFGGGPLVALAAGGFRGQDRAWVRSRPVAVAACGFRRHDHAWVRVTAHTFELAGGGRVWWVPEVKGRPPAGSTAWGRARPADGLRPATVRLCCLVPHGAASRCGAAVAACGCAVFWVPRPVSASRKQTGPVASSRIAPAGHRPRPAGHHRTGLLGYARRRGEEPRTRHPYGEKDPPKGMASGDVTPSTATGTKATQL